MFSFQIRCFLILITLINFFVNSTSLFASTQDPCTIVVFDCAQGNAVAARYKTQTMVFDLGRRAQSEFVKYEDDKSGKSIINQRFVLEENTKLKAYTVPQQGYELQELIDNKKAYQQEFEKRFKDFAQGNNTLKAVFISHPDTDHYNLVAKFELEPELFLLGGEYELYNKTFQDYLVNYDGKVVQDNKNTPVTLKDYTDALKSHNFKGKDSPRIKVLSANASKNNTKRDKNADSMIVKISQAYSMLLTGDAEKDTWKDAVGSQGKEELKSDVLLLSHHGAATNGSTSAEILRIIQPKICIISAGFQHGHPAKVTIDTLLKYYETTSYRTLPHFVTYYDGDIRASYFTNAPIFTTIDNGALTINLCSNLLSVDVARDFSPCPARSLEDGDFIFSLQPILTRDFMKFTTFKQNKGRKPVSSSFGEGCYKLKEKYYYRVGDACIEMRLIEEPVDGDEEVEIADHQSWLKDHPEAHISLLTPISVDRGITLLEDENIRMSKTKSKPQKGKSKKTKN
jgi:hypothetical protein